ncbi:MAG TPA: SURF1 family protein [Dokdonella sp.]|uniref:SURF1 family protein n=1 Tax=Dokdonella sp. TaxID=2291710 RepID=UPI0025B8EFFF|nr:SURF1 family protein [Dokdonella sp.]MBX3691076.1 SURF1 family protein [Dokdonella sp.]HNR92791.1 SURF1 family protein [Dokdonella sp.]
MARHWTSPSWFALVLLLAGLGVFITLGFWQLDRAHEKDALLDAFAADAAQAPLTLADARRRAASMPYPRVRVHGRYDPLRSYLLDDQVRDGRQGLLAWAVFEPDGGGPALLVNRGFVARGSDGKQPVLPAVETGEVELSGLYASPPGGGLRLGGNALPRQSRWPKSTIYIDTAEIAQDIGRAVDTRVLLLDADPASGFMRAWTPQIIPPERHRGYALQWFSFAIAAIVIFIVLHWRRASNGSK